MGDFFREMSRYVWFAFGVIVFGAGFWGLTKAGMAQWAPTGLKEAVATAA